VRAPEEEVAIMQGSIHLGRIAGISIDINYSWLIILVLLTFSLATTWFPQTITGASALTYWILGLIAALLLFASVLAHELAHSFVARARGLSVKSITLFIFGGVSNIEQEPQNAGVEFQVAVVGPLTSLIIGAVAWALALATRGVSAPVTAVLGYLGISNLLLGVFNLIPGFPLDGGRVLRSILWAATGSLRKATQWASRVGQVVAFLFIFYGILQFFTGNVLGGIWIGFIGWFLLSAAQTANQQVMLETMLRGVTVGNLMSPPPEPVPASNSIEQVVYEYMMPRGVRAVPVVDDGRLVGMLTLGSVRDLPREQWASVPLRQVMIPFDKLHTVQPAQPLSDVLTMMINEDINQVPVTANGQVVGMLSREAIVRYVEMRRSLGVPPQQRTGQPQQTTTPVAP
jgi:Zn-dependent protease/CBS domain-containing protein